MRRIEAILAQRVALVARRRQQRIQPQIIMIVDVFVAQSQPEDPLRQHLLHGVVNKYCWRWSSKHWAKLWVSPRLASTWRSSNAPPSLRGCHRKSATTWREPKS